MLLSSTAKMKVTAADWGNNTFVPNVADFLPKQEISNLENNLNNKRKYVAVLQFTVAAPGGGRSQMCAAGTLFTHSAGISDLFGGNTKTVVSLNFAIQTLSSHKTIVLTRFERQVDTSLTHI